MLMFRCTVLSLAAVSVVACGSTSSLSAVNTGAHGATAQAAPVAFESYNRVVVKEFANKVPGSEATADVGSFRFANAIVNRLRGNINFKDVVLQRPGEAAPAITADTLVVDGDITRYTEGNAALRMFVGMGAGSSYFDATVNVRDGLSGKVLAQSKVDLNSWGLGGGMAAEQTVDNFMNDAASKVATDLVSAKNGKLAPANGAVASTTE